MTMFSQSGTEKVTQCRNLDSFLRIPTPPPPPVPAPSSAMLPEDLEVSPLIMIVSPSKHDGLRMEILAPEQVTSGPSGWTKSVEQKYLLNNCQLPLGTHKFKIVGLAVEIDVFMSLRVHPCSLSEAEFSIVIRDHQPSSNQHLIFVRAQEGPSKGQC